MKNHLVIFVKEPRLGKVKTRLAKGIGRVAAWRFYKKTVSALIKRMRNSKWQITLCVSPDDYCGAFFPYDLPINAQGSGDLGQRMQRVFNTMPRGKVVLIGGDIPAIEQIHITKAFKSLRNNDIIFGPATDGGYWLVGMCRTRKCLTPFENVRWSTQYALQDTLNNLSHNTRYELVDELYDIDTVHDLPPGYFTY